MMCVCVCVFISCFIMLHCWVCHFFEWPILNSQDLAGSSGLQELASLCVRGQVHQVVEALQKPELVKFASQPLDAAGQPRHVDL